MPLTMESGRRERPGSDISPREIQRDFRSAVNTRAGIFPGRERLPGPAIYTGAFRPVPLEPPRRRSLSRESLGVAGRPEVGACATFEPRDCDLRDFHPLNFHALDLCGRGCVDACEHGNGVNTLEREMKIWISARGDRSRKLALRRGLSYNAAVVSGRDESGNCGVIDVTR